MEEVFRTNDPVDLSFAEHVLNESGISYFIADLFMSAVEGNIGAFPKRILVAKDEAADARAVLKEALPGAANWTA
jgi:hypothetical protein